MIWKPIPGFEGIYEASDRGEIRSLPRKVPQRSRWGGERIYPHQGRELKPSFNPTNGYSMVTLSVDGEKSPFNVHRLVAMAFHGARDGTWDVNHKDGDKTNNAPANLEWVTREENMAHAREIGLVASPRRVIATPLNGGDVLIFESRLDAAQKLGNPGKQGNIGSALCGRIPSAYGYKWAYTK